MRLKKAGRENKLHKPQRGEVLPDDFFLRWYRKGNDNFSKSLAYGTIQ